jgi:chromosome segregation ATPase
MTKYVKLLLSLLTVFVVTLFASGLYAQTGDAGDVGVPSSDGTTRVDNRETQPSAGTPVETTGLPVSPRETGNVSPVKPIVPPKSINGVSPARPDFSGTMNDFRKDRAEALKDMRAKTEAIRAENKALLKDMSTSTRPETLQKVRANREEMLKLREETRDAIKEKREEAKNKIEDQRNTFREEVKKRNFERTNERLNQALASLSRLFERLVDINSRLEARIAEIEKNGVNVSTVKSALSDAKTKAEIAKSKIDYAKTVVGQGVTDNQSLGAVKAAFATAHQSYKDARKKTEEVMKLVRELVLSQIKKATTTPAVR